MAQAEQLLRFFGTQGSRFRSFLDRIEHRLAPHDPLVAVIRREGRIVEGRYVLFFEVTLFGENPVVLEEFGAVFNRETHPCSGLTAEMAQAVRPYRYFTEFQQRFKTVEDAAHFWSRAGATVLWDG